MSYILDALRRADAERERGVVPGLYAQPALSDGAAPERALWPWAATAVVVVAGGVALFNGLTAGPETTPAQVPTDPAAGPPAVPSATAQAAGPAVLSAVTPPAPVRVASPPPAATAPRPPALAPAPEPAPLRSPAPVRPPEITPASPGAPVEAPAASGTARAAATPAPPRATGADSAGRVLAFDELPDDVRRSLPALAINGASYSETPAHRLLIANGQVFREGEEPAPGLVLEQIRLKSAVLRYGGVRYSVPY
jgi:general secretion pathway protein B